MPEIVEVSSGTTAYVIEDTEDTFSYSVSEETIETVVSDESVDVNVTDEIFDFDFTGSAGNVVRVEDSGTDKGLFGVIDFGENLTAQDDNGKVTIDSEGGKTRDKDVPSQDDVTIGDRKSLVIAGDRKVDGMMKVNGEVKIV